MTLTTKLIAIDPSSHDYYEDRLFDVSNAFLNRDDTLTPFVRLKSALEARGMDVHTADYLWGNAEKLQGECDYYSLGVLHNVRKLAGQKGVHFRAFLIMEPPVVAPGLYLALPELSRKFDRIYLHNTHGDGYSLSGLDQSKLRKLYWPQPREEVIETLWQRQYRQRRIVVINGNHKPKSVSGELYSKRIEAMVALAKFGVIDLYGRGWGKWWSRASQWMPYWCNRNTIMSIYKGSCTSKYEVMADYTFALCFENMVMQGYVTEKIFDCFYAGTIPLYWGATNIADLIPEDAYIDCRNYESWAQMLEVIMSMSEEQIQLKREAGREFIRSSEGLKYYNSMLEIVSE